MVPRTLQIIPGAPSLNPMFTTIVVALAILLALSLAGALSVQWRARRQAESALVVAREELAVLRERARALETREKSQSELSETFRGMASTALQTSMQQFFQMAQSTFERANQIHKLDSEQRHKAMDDMVKPMAEALERYQKQLSELESERLRAFHALDGELKKVSESHALLARETTALKDALKKPHVRGRWGEVQLRNCIELAGMSEYADVSFQEVHEDEEGIRHIPDMLVRMPGGRRVIVDAKTPIDGFIAALEAPTEELRQAERLRHGRLLREHVKRLSSRAYAENIKESADFTVMFLPNESFLYAALEVEPDIVEFALQKKVLITTPPTLIGLLKVIRFGWGEQRLAENAQRISQLGQELHKRLCDFVETYLSVGQHIERARDEFEKGRSRLESRVLVQARRFEALGAKSSKKLGEAPPDPLSTSDTQ